MQSANTVRIHCETHSNEYMKKLSVKHTYRPLTHICEFYTPHYCATLHYPSNNIHYNPSIILIQYTLPVPYTQNNARKRFIVTYKVGCIYKFLEYIIRFYTSRFCATFRLPSSTSYFTIFFDTIYTESTKYNLLV